MAHELTIRDNGIVEAMYANRPAWHNLGTVLDHAPSSEEAIKQSGLDWEINFQELQMANGTPIPDAYATYRTDNGKPLGIVSERYKIVQNRDAFDFLDGLLQDGIMQYESAGSLKGGKIVWVLARLPSVDYVVPGDALLSYLLFSTTHDGTGAVNILPTRVRVVCANTHRVAIAGHKGFRHTGDVAGKMQRAREMVSQCDKQFTLFREQASELAGIQVTREKGSEYIETLFPSIAEIGRAQSIRENKVNQMRRNFNNARNTLPEMKGSWWSLYNAVSEYVDHDSTVRGVGIAKSENRMLSVMDGQGADLKNKAFELALRMAAA